MPWMSLILIIVVGVGTSEVLYALLGPVPIGNYLLKLLTNASLSQLEKSLNKFKEVVANWWRLTEVGRKWTNTVVLYNLKY